MFLELPDVLSARDLDRLRAIAAKARFVDGKLSSPHSQVKENLQIDHGDAAYQDSTKIMADALAARSEAMVAFAFPRVLAPPMLAKYAAGMRYGPHVDAAFLPLPTRALRSDLSCTIFIARPGDYEGGELSIDLGGRKIDFKGAAGSAVIYPSTTLHEVKPVTAGERLVDTSPSSRASSPIQRTATCSTSSTRSRRWRAST